MKITDKTSKTFNVVLSAFYVPLSLFSWLLQMASEGTIDATNPLHISLINIFCVVAFFVPFLCIAGIVLSVVLRRKGHNVLSFHIQFLPLVVFVLDLILLAVAESLVA